MTKLMTFAVFLLSPQTLVVRAPKKEYLVKIGTPNTGPMPVSVFVGGGWGLHVEATRTPGNQVSVEINFDHFGGAAPEFAVTFEADRFVEFGTLTHRTKGLGVSLTFPDNGAYGHIVRVSLRRIAEDGVQYAA